MVYDGAAHSAESAEELRRWLEVADETGRPLFINHGSQSQLEKNLSSSEDRKEKRRSEFLEIVEDRKLFKVVEPFYGIDPGTNRTVLKYIPNSFRR